MSRATIANTDRPLATHSSLGTDGTGLLGIEALLCDLYVRFFFASNISFFTSNRFFVL